MAASASVAISLRPQAALVDVARVDRGPLQVTVDEDGQTRIKERYIVSTPLAGQLQRIALKVGDPVVANQTILARMQPTDPSLLDPRAVAQARARVKAAEQRLEAARAELNKAEAAVNFAEVEMGRVRQLHRENAVSQRELDERVLQFRLETEEARAAAFGVDIAEYELELERAALLLTDPAAQSESAGDPEAAADAAMELQIRAPINGRVLRLYQESAGVLTAGEALMELGDPTDLEIVADVLSVDAVRVEPGADVIIDHWGGDRPLAGRVRIVEPSGFTKISALGVEEQRVNVIIDLVDPPEARSSLGDGFRVETRIVTWQRDSTLRVPTSALFRVDDQWQVFTIRDGLAQPVAVEIGVNNGITAQLLGGLDEGDAVIVHPSDAVQASAAVEPR